MTFDPSPLRNLPPDELYAPDIKPHTLEKFKAHNYNAQIFVTAMKAKWPQLAYLGLYAGAGRARIKKTNEFVETTATSVFRFPDRFTHHVFVDRNPKCTSALAQRIKALGYQGPLSILTGDVNLLISEVRAALPAFRPGHGLLSYCFVDPFGADLKFRTIQALSDLRIDFLMLLAVGVDIRRNFDRYLQDEHDTRIADLVNCPDWRVEWREDQATRRSSRIGFLTRKFDEAMTSIGYKSVPPDFALPVKVTNRNVLLYDLVYYTKSELGLKFWRETTKGVKPQFDIFS